jgi:small-conductance mechanosensitive channel
MGYLGFGGLSFVFELVFASPMLYLANRYFRRRISLISIGVVGFGLWFLPMLALLLALPRHAPNIPVTGVLSGIVGITGLVSAYVFALVATRPTPAGQV